MLNIVVDYFWICCSIRVVSYNLCSSYNSTEASIDFSVGKREDTEAENFPLQFK
jgi:hypothetical protein